MSQLSTKEVRQKWVAALKSGEYKQGTESLHRKFEDGGKDEFCCLGVLCDLYAKDHPEVNYLTQDYFDKEGNHSIAYYQEAALPPQEVMDWAGIDMRYAIELAKVNDEGAGFPHLATMIENFK